MNLTTLRAATRQALVLNFHGVGPALRELEPGEDDVWLTREGLAASLAAVVGRGDVRITFDDGNLSDVTIALPELLARGMTAAFFIPAARVGTKGSLDERAVRDLVEAGMDVGTHGMHHRSWVGLDDRSLHEELVEARDRLEQIAGRTITEAACPFGAYDRRSLRALRDAGYERVYTSDRGFAREGAWLQPRNTLHRDRHEEEIEDLLQGPGLLSFVREARTAVKRWR